MFNFHPAAVTFGGFFIFVKKMLNTILGIELENGNAKILGSL